MMGWFSNIAKKVKDVATKTVQTIIPGGSKGYLEPKKPTPAPTKEAGVPSFTEGSVPKKAPAGSKVVSKSSSPSDVISGKGVTTLGEEGGGGLTDKYGRTIGTTPGGQIEKAKEGIGFIGDVLTGEQGLEDVKARIDPQEASALRGLGLGAGIATGAALIGPAMQQATKYWGSLTAGNAGASVGAPAGEVAINTQTIAQTTGIVSKFFSAKAMALYGAWAGAVSLGKWGQAESTEAITFPITKFLIPEAERTGDWTAVDESLKLAEEMGDLSTWEKIGLYTPLSPFIGVPKKIAGVAAGVEILNKYKEDQKEKQELGLTEAQYWENRKADEDEQNKINIDYYNDERKKMVAWELEAEAEARRVQASEYGAGKEKQREADIKARNDDARFWREQRELQLEREAEDRRAIADFWTTYRKQAQKIADNNRPSNLNFGLV